MAADIRIDHLTTLYTHKLHPRGANLIEEGFALEVFRLSPKYCASLPSNNTDSTMAFAPILKDMGYLTRVPK